MFLQTPTMTISAEHTNYDLSNDGHLSRRIVALLCSSKCPGSIVVGALDVASALRDVQVELASGFQSPVERECLKFLLKGTVPLVVCPARSATDMRMPAAWKPAIQAGRLTIRSAIDERFEAPAHQGISKPKRMARRATTALAELRNRFVASISDAVLILHASPGGKLDRLANELLAAGKPLWTLDDPSNRSLISRGARSLTPETVSRIWGASTPVE